MNEERVERLEALLSRVQENRKRTRTPAGLGLLKPEVARTAPEAAKPVHAVHTQTAAGLMPPQQQPVAAAPAPAPFAPPSQPEPARPAARPAPQPVAASPLRSAAPPPSTLGLGSAAPLSVTPYSVSMQTIFGTATGSVYRRDPPKRPAFRVYKYCPVVTRSI